MRKILALIPWLCFATLLLGVKPDALSQNSFQLHGIWKINADKSVALFDQNQKAFYDSLPSESKLRYQQGFANRTLKFSGTDKLEIFLIREGHEIIIPGTWTIEEENVLVLNFPTSATRYIIDSAQGDVIILKVEDMEDERGKAVFSQLYLEKQND